MKKITKVVAGMMLLSMGANVAVAMPNLNLDTVSAATINAYSFNGFTSEVELGKKVLLPTVPTNVVRTVINPKGNVVVIGDDNLLSATIKGDYLVRYTSAIENSAYGKSVQEFKITVTGETLSIVFNSNEEDIIPKKTNFDKAITLPTPSVKNSAGDEIAGNCTVKVTAPDHTTVMKEGVSLSVGDSFTPDQDGIYTIVYQYNDGTYFASKTFSFTSDENYDADRLLSYSLDSSMPTSFNLGEKTTLPTVTVKDINNGDEEVSAYYTITIEDKDDSSNVIIADSSDNSFTPTVAGKYVVTYKINDFFGSELSGCNNNEYSYAPIEAKDSIAPTPMFVEEYDTVAQGETSEVKVSVDSINSANTEVPSKIYLTESTTKAIVLPAIFATDANEVKKVDDDANYKYNTDNITYTRRLVNENGVTVKEWTDDDVDANKNINVTLSLKTSDDENTIKVSEGSYKLEYVAKDSYGSKEVTLSVEIIEDLSNADNVAPVITFDSYKPAYLKAGEEVSFAKPTVVDYSDSDNTIGDTRVFNETKYYFNSDSTNAINIEEDEDNSDNLMFTMPDTVDGISTITIVTTATDDDNNTSSEQYTINVIGGSTDSVVPTINGDLILTSENIDNSNPESAVDQLQTVNISEVTVSDNDKNFGAYITVRYFTDNADDLGTEVALANSKTSYTKNDTTSLVTLSNASFVASNAGTYVVSVIGQDLNGNTAVKSTSIAVNDTVAPTINTNWKYTNVELGKSIILPQVEVWDNGLDISATAPVTIEVEGAGNYKLNGYEFTPLLAGNYKITFKSEDTSGNAVTSSTYTVTSSDTIAPEITLDDTFYETKDLVEVADGYEAVSIPGFTPTDTNGINWDETYVEVKSNSGSLIDVTETENGYEFAPIGNGSYTVTYTATDKNGNTTTEEHTVKVGDTTGPDFKGVDDLVLPTKTVGDKLVLNLDSVTVSDTIDESLEADSYEVRVYDPSNNIVSKSEDGDVDYYELSSQGEYTVEFKSTDKAGNTTTEERTFQVSAETSSPAISSEGWGIILIIASLLLLGGVVFYFFKTRKVVSKPRKSTNTKKISK